MPVLRVKAGSNKGHVFDLTKTDSMSIGRDCPDGVQVLDQGVSRRHAEVFRIGEMFFLRDLQSRNGVFLNDEKIVEELLQPGDQIRIGQTTFAFESDADQARAVAATELPKKPEVIEFDDDDHETSYSNTLMLDLDLRAGYGADDGAPAPAAAGGNGESSATVPASKVKAAPVESRENAYLNIFYQLAKTLSAEKTLVGLFNDFLKVAANAVNADAAYVFVRGAKPNSFVPRASWHRDEAAGGKKAGQSVSTSIIKRTIDFGKPILTSDAGTDARFSTNKSIVLKQVRSVICAPLAVREKVQGAVYLNMMRAERSFAAEDLELISALSLQVSIAMDSIQAAGRQRENLFNIVRAMVGLIEERDPDSKGRSLRVMNIAAAIGQTLKVKPEARYWIELAALLHDVGTLAVNPDEAVGMSAAQRCEAIVVAGEKFVKSMKTMDSILPGIRWQFARFDGTGWPADATAVNTPLPGKIVCVARDFDALQSQPDPATGQPPAAKQLLVSMSKLAGSRYDPQVIHALLLAAKQGTLFNPAPILTNVIEA